MPPISTIGLGRRTRLFAETGAGEPPARITAFISSPCHRPTNNRMASGIQLGTLVAFLD